MRRALAAWLLIVVGCSGSESAGGPSAPVDSGAEAAIDGGSTNDRLTLAKTLEQLVVGSCREVDVGVPIDVQAYIEIGSTAEAEPFFAHVSSTGKNADSVQGIASASKWPSSVTIVEALSDPEGKGAPPGTSVTALKLLPKSKSSDGFTFVSSVTPPSDVIEGITLEHLLSFSSGFHVNESGGPSAWDTCANDLAETNTSCAITALSRRPKSIVSGSVFSYGSLHLEVAAAMAEERTGQSFVELVEARLNARLGLTDAARFRFPRPLTPEKDHPNPLVAGGMHTSARSYRAFLRGLAAGTFKAWAAVDPDRSRIAGLPRVIDPAAIAPRRRRYRP